MKTIIESNGSKWAGEAPDSIEILLDVLSREPLDHTFEKYGNFISSKPLRGAVSIGRGRYKETDLIYPDAPDMVRFWGNFANLSHVFQIDSNDPEVIAKLRKAIRANQRTEAYQQLKGALGKAA